MGYKFESDYIFTRFGTCRACCPDHLGYYTWQFGVYKSLDAPLSAPIFRSLYGSLLRGVSSGRQGAVAPKLMTNFVRSFVKRFVLMPLGMEVGLSPGDFVLHRNPAPSQKGGPNFRPMSIVATWLDGSRWHLAWRWALVQATLC